MPKNVRTAHGPSSVEPMIETVLITMTASTSRSQAGAERGVLARRRAAPTARAPAPPERLEEVERHAREEQAGEELQRVFLGSSWSPATSRRPAPHSRSASANADPATSKPMLAVISFHGAGGPG